MSVLIKDVKMPKNCVWCPCSRIDSVYIDLKNNEVLTMYCGATHKNWTCYRYSYDKPTWCPLVEVPTPHGRLI